MEYNLNIVSYRLNNYRFIFIGQDFNTDASLFHIICWFKAAV